MADLFDQFVGIPFRDHGRDLDGADCWGLVRLALLKVAGLDLPSYDEHYASVIERRANDEMIKGAMGDWLPVVAGSERRCDVIVMRDGKYDSHIAVVTRPGRMLHTYQGGASCVDRYHNPPFRQRLVSFHRHRSLLAGAEASPA